TGPSGSSLAGGPYTVKVGDSLSRIAQTTYHHEIYYKAIIYWNDIKRGRGMSGLPQLGDPNHVLQPGEMIYLPSDSEVSRYENHQVSNDKILTPVILEDVPASDLNIVGSSTVFPLMNMEADCFVNAGFLGSIDIIESETERGLYE